MSRFAISVSAHNSSSWLNPSKHNWRLKTANEAVSGSFSNVHWRTSTTVNRICSMNDIVWFKSFLENFYTRVEWCVWVSSESVCVRESVYVCVCVREWVEWEWKSECEARVRVWVCESILLKYIFLNFGNTIFLFISQMLRIMFRQYYPSLYYRLIF